MRGPKKPQIYSGHWPSTCSFSFPRRGVTIDPQSTKTNWKSIAPPPDDVERRVHRRLKCNGTGEIRIFPEGIKVVGAVVDLSLNGCCLEFDSAVPAHVNTRVEIYLNVKGITLQLAGEIRHLQTRGQAGIEFIDVSRRKAEQIQELIHELYELEQNFPKEAPSGLSASPVYRN